MNYVNNIGVISNRNQHYIQYYDMFTMELKNLNEFMSWEINIGVICNGITL